MTTLPRVVCRWGGLSYLFNSETRTVGIFPICYIFRGCNWPFVDVEVAPSKRFSNFHLIGNSMAFLKVVPNSKTFRYNWFLQPLSVLWRRILLSPDSLILLEFFDPMKMDMYSCSSYQCAAYCLLLRESSFHIEQCVPQFFLDR